MSDRIIRAINRFTTNQFERDVLVDFIDHCELDPSNICEMFYLYITERSHRVDPTLIHRFISEFEASYNYAPFLVTDKMIERWYNAMNGNCDLRRAFKIYQMIPHNHPMCKLYAERYVLNDPSMDHILDEFEMVVFNPNAVWSKIDTYFTRIESRDLVYEYACSYIRLKSYDSCYDQGDCPECSGVIIFYEGRYDVTISSQDCSRCESVLRIP